MSIMCSHPILSELVCFFSSILRNLIRRPSYAQLNFSLQQLLCPPAWQVTDMLQCVVMVCHIPLLEGPKGSINTRSQEGGVVPYTLSDNWAMAQPGSQEKTRVFKPPKDTQLQIQNNACVNNDVTRQKDKTNQLYTPCTALVFKDKKKSCPGLNQNPRHSCILWSTFTVCVVWQSTR